MGQRGIDPTRTKAEYITAATTMAERFGLNKHDVVPLSLGQTIYSDTFGDAGAYKEDALYVFVHDTPQTRVLSTEEIESSLQRQRITAIEVFWYQGRADESPLLIRVSEYAPGDETFTAFFSTERECVESLAHRMTTESSRQWIVTHSNISEMRESGSPSSILAD
jgi:hypothetical protein